MKIRIYRNNPRRAIHYKGWHRARINRVSMIWAGPIFVTVTR